MTDKVEPDIQNSGISNEPETVIQPPVPTEDKTLLRPNALTDRAIDEPTRKFDVPANQVQTNRKTEFETEPTKVLPDESQDAPDENALRPSRLRFALVCLFFAFVAGWSFINLVQQISVVSSAPEWTVDWEDKRFAN